MAPLHATRIGRLGERIAGHYLELVGYEIIERNVRLSRVEIDLVAKRGGVLCFVEVRLRRHSVYGSAVETVLPAKQRHLRRAMELYLRRHPTGCYRFDVIAIDLEPGSGLRLLHVKHAFA